MDAVILDLLKQQTRQRDWQEIVENFHPIPVRTIKGQGVYEFFSNLDDELELNLQPITLTVNPINSFVPFHLHNYVEMILVLKGQLTLELEEETIHLKEGDIFIASPNLIHKNVEIGSEDVVLNIALRKTAFSSSDLDFLRRIESGGYLTDILFFVPSNHDKGNYTVFHTQQEDGLKPTLTNIIYEYYKKSDAQASHIIRHELLIFFAKLLRLSTQPDHKMLSNRKEESNLLSLLHYIETNYAHATLEEMGDHFGFNPNYLSTYLKKQTGKSFIKLVHLQRINVAADYLLYTDAPIEKISLQVGYENPSYFYKIFKKILGLSPAEYRKERR